MLGPFPRTIDEVSSPLIPRWRLTELSRTGLWVRLAVAECERTPPQLLAVLAKDSDNQVRELVSRNYASPVPILDALSRDPRWSVRVAVATNPATPAHTLKRLSHHPYTPIRAAVAWNLNTADRERKRLCRDWRREVRATAASYSAQAACRPPLSVCTDWEDVVEPYGREVEKLAWGLVREGFAGTLEALAAMVVGTLAE